MILRHPLDVKSGQSNRTSDTIRIKEAAQQFA